MSSNEPQPKMDRRYGDGPFRMGVVLDLETVSYLLRESRGGDSGIRLNDYTHEIDLPPEGREILSEYLAANAAEEDLLVRDGLRIMSFADPETGGIRIAVSAIVHRKNPVQKIIPFPRGRQRKDATQA